MKRTPAPWIYRRKFMNGVVAGAGWEIIHPTPETAPEIKDELISPLVWSEPNARLICAATELLDACETVLLCADLNHNPSTRRLLQRAIALAGK